MYRPAPVEPAPPPSVRTEVVYPERRTWLQWWESNREEFLRPAPLSAADHLVQKVQVPDHLRAKAVEALTGLLRSQSWRDRAEAAIALGRIGDASALDALQKMAGRDTNKTARQAAQLGIALLGGDRAEQALVKAAVRPDPAGRGALSALAATTKQWSEQATRDLSRAARGRDAQTSSAALRALRNEQQRPDAQVFREILATTKNPWLTVEAILGLGAAESVPDVPLLSNLLLGADGATDAPCWRAIQISRGIRLATVGQFAATEQRAYQDSLARYVDELNQWSRMTGRPASPQQRRQPGAPEWHVVPVGLEEIFLGHFRAAAAVALGRIDDPRARAALVQALAQDGREWGALSQDPNALARIHQFSELHKAMAIMSLGRNGDESGLQALLATLAGQIPNIAGYPPERLKDSPLRAYAALALGIYARPVAKDDQQLDRAGWDRACRALAERLQDATELPDVRTAAALALGLASRPQNLKTLQAIDVRKEPDMMLAGHLLLARAMLADAGVPALAEALLLRERPDGTVGDTLGRRAAVLAMGVLGGPDVVLVLKWAHGQPGPVREEVGRALALGKGFNAAEELIETVRNGQDAKGRAVAARWLGQLLMKEDRDPLSQLIRDSVYALRDDASQPVRDMAGEFLGRLVPTFQLASRK